MWATFVIDDIERDIDNWETFDRIKQRLELVPSDIEGLYRRLLGDIAAGGWLDTAIPYLSLLLVHSKIRHDEWRALSLLHFVLMDVEVCEHLDLRDSNFLESTDFTHACKRVQARINVCCRSLITISDQHDWRLLGIDAYHVPTVDLGINAFAKYVRPIVTKSAAQTFPLHYVGFAHRSIEDFLRARSVEVFSNSNRNWEQTESLANVSLLKCTAKIVQFVPHIATHDIGRGFCLQSRFDLSPLLRQILQLLMAAESTALSSQDLGDCLADFIHIWSQMPKSVRLAHRAWYDLKDKVSPLPVMHPLQSALYPIAKLGCLERLETKRFISLGPSMATSLLGVSIAAVAEHCKSIPLVKANTENPAPEYTRPLLGYLKDIQLLLGNGANPNAVLACLVPIRMVHLHHRFSSLDIAEDLSVQESIVCISLWAHFLVSIPVLFTAALNAPHSYEPAQRMQRRRLHADSISLPPTLALLLTYKTFLLHGADLEASIPEIWKFKDLPYLQQDWMNGTIPTDVCVQTRGVHLVRWLFSRIFTEELIPEFLHSSFQSPEDLVDLFGRPNIPTEELSTRFEIPKSWESVSPPPVLIFFFKRTREALLDVKIVKQASRAIILDEMAKRAIHDTAPRDWRLALQPYIDDTFPVVTGPCLLMITPQSIVCVRRDGTAFEHCNRGATKHLKISSAGDIVRVLDDGTTEPWNSPFTDVENLAIYMRSGEDYGYHSETDSTNSHWFKDDSDVEARSIDGSADGTESWYTAEEGDCSPIESDNKEAATRDNKTEMEGSGTEHE